MKIIQHKVDTEFFEGTVEIDVPSYVERLRIMKELNFKIVDGKVETNEDTLEKMAKQVEKLATAVKSVNLKLKKSGEEIKTIDELGFYSEGAAVIMGLSGYITSGFTLGNA